MPTTRARRHDALDAPKRRGGTPPCAPGCTCKRHGNRFDFRPPAARFWEKVNTDGPVSVEALGPCWIWTAARLPKGYGLFGLNARNVYAHRWVYEQIVGPIPEGLEIDHLCGTPCCVMPFHMEAVTRRVNTLRSTSVAARNAKKATCPAGHPYDGTRVRHGRTERICTVCDRANAARREAAKRAG